MVNCAMGRTSHAGGERRAGASQQRENRPLSVVPNKQLPSGMQSNRHTEVVCAAGSNTPCLELRSTNLMHAKHGQRAMKLNVKRS